MKKYMEFFIIIIQTLIYIGAAYAFVRFFPTLFSIGLPFLIGWLISVIVTPVVNILKKKCYIPKKLSAFIFILVVLAIGVGITYSLVNIMVSQVEGMINDFPDAYQYILNAADKANDYTRKFIKSDIIPEEKLREILQSSQDYLMGKLPDIGRVTLGYAGSFAKGIPSAIVFFIVTVLASYFLIIEREHVQKSIHKMIPQYVRDRRQAIREHFFNALGGYIKAQFKIMTVIFCILLIGFTLLDVRYAFLLAFCIGLFDAIPAFGTGIILNPWGLITIAGGDLEKGLALMGLYVVCFITRQIIEPKIVGDSIGLPPLVTIFSMYTGFKLFGALGMFLGAPTTIVLLHLHYVGLFNPIINHYQSLMTLIRKSHHLDED